MIVINFRVIGEKKLQADLRRLSVRARQRVHAAIYEGGLLVRDEARDLMRRPKSGKYVRRGGVVHRASAPGEAPAIDTGNLFGNLIVDASGISAGVVRVVADTPYAGELEEPNEKNRPYLRPALSTHAATIRARVAMAIRRAMRPGA